MFPFGARLLLAHFASSSTSTPSALQTLRRSLPLLPRPRFNQSVTMSTGLDIVHTAGAAQPVGPYSQAIKVNGQIFLSGQIPLTKDGVLIEGTIGEKTRLCCENIKAVVEAAGSSVEKIFKVTVLLADMADFDEMNQEYGKFFAHKPARSCFAVKQLPKGVPVEIECIALA